MTLPEKMLAELKWAQQLCDALQDETAELERAIALAKSIQKKRAALEDFYTKRWLQICESPELSAEDRDALIFRTLPGKYSILGEDTIWDALQEAHEVQVRLLKKLAKGL